MIITIIAFSIFIIGIILKVIYENRMFKLSRKIMNAIDYISFTLLFIGFIATTITIVVLCSNFIDYELRYQNFLHEREMIEYRIEHVGDNITGNEMLYNDIVKFNNELRGTKRYVNSPWTNWFSNKDIASLDYIELGGE